MLVQGAHGDFSNLTTKSTVKRQASSNFTAIKRNQGGTFRNSSRVQLGFRASTRTGQRSLEKQRNDDAGRQTGSNVGCTLHVHIQRRLYSALRIIRGTMVRAGKQGAA